MNEIEFHRLADAALDHVYDTLESVDAEGKIDVENEQGIVTIDLPGGKQLLISKHAPTRQLWLSSPVSGGLHFSHASDTWQLADGRMLFNIVAAELETLAGVKVEF